MKNPFFIYKFFTLKTVSRHNTTEIIKKKKGEAEGFHSLPGLSIKSVTRYDQPHVVKFESDLFLSQCYREKEKKKYLRRDFHTHPHEFMGLHRGNFQV